MHSLKTNTYIFDLIMVKMNEGRHSLGKNQSLGIARGGWMDISDGMVVEATEKKHQQICMHDKSSLCF